MNSSSRFALLLTVLISLFILTNCGDNPNPGDEHGKFIEKLAKFTPGNKQDFYESVLKRNERWRVNHSTKKPPDFDKIERHLVEMLTDSIFPFWIGTKWGFYGTTQVPGKGKIACGYFVSTTLEHAGFDIERIKLAQQASSVIISTLCNKKKTIKYLHYLLVIKLDKFKCFIAKKALTYQELAV